MKKKFRIILAVILFISLAYEVCAQNKDTADNIIIYGDSFLFSIHEPAGWAGNVDNAKDYNANIIFYKSKTDFEKGGTFIQILTYKKQDEEVNKDLDFEISNLKEKNHDLKQKDMDSENEKLYPTWFKLAYVENIFYQYIAYINPGTKFHNAFSITMNIPKRAATKEELTAFKEIISTLVVFKR